MVIEEVAEINMALLPAQNTDLLWRICQVGAAGRPKGLGPVNLLGYSWAGVKVELRKEVILCRPRHTEKAFPKHLEIFQLKFP